MYTKKHPGTNLEPILKTPFMTEENSEFSATDEEVRKQLLTKAREDVGMTEKEITEGIKVLEVRSLAWRSRKVSHSLCITIMTNYLLHDSNSFAISTRS